MIVNVVFVVIIHFSADNQANIKTPRLLNSEKIKLLPTRVSCLEWGDFFGNDLRRAETAITGLELSGKLSQNLIDVIAAYWVYIPPFSRTRDTNREIRKLKKLGIDNFQVQEEGAWHNAISLAVLRDKLAAQILLAELKNKGIAKATIGERNIKQIKFVIREPTVGVHAKMKIMAEKFVGSQLVATTCARL